MKITKLPDVIDPSKLIQKEVRQRNNICPFCKRRGLWGGELRFTKSWYGKQNYKLKSLFQKSHHWEIDYYKCYSCGAEWETDPYPTDITGI